MTWRKRIINNLCEPHSEFIIFVFKVREVIQTIMVNSSARRQIVLLLSIFIYSSALFSQFDNTDFLRAGTRDGAKIAEAYFTPWANAFGAGVNGSWYNTAKPHKFGGFDLTFGVNVGFVPSSANTFDVTKIGLTEFTGTGMAPTVAGPDRDGPLLTGPSAGGITPISFTTPAGSNWGYMPVPTLTAGIGLPLGTEVRIRYIPKISVSGGNISSWGVGLLHSIMQYIPGDKVLPFDISLFGGYTKLEGNVPLDMQPDLDPSHRIIRLHIPQDHLIIRILEQLFRHGMHLL